MHSKMNALTKRSFLWPTVASCLLILDYALFTTGNPSLTYSVLGGWFLIPLLAVVVITASYSYSTVARRQDKRNLIMHFAILGVFSVVLFIASPYAGVFASDRLQAELNEFVKDPARMKAAVSDDMRRLMMELNKQKYSMERETFIPTFRRMDYLLKAETGAKYRLIMTMSWNGIPEISLRRVDS